MAILARALTIIAIAFGLTLASVSYGAAPARTGQTEKGDALVNSEGMSLYVYDKDEKGKSNCYDRCAQNWPPLMAEKGTSAEGDWSVIERNDGSFQWAYKGAPLYTWVKDTKPGDATGDGVGGVWKLARP